jgi:hypothetical protein
MADRHNLNLTNRANRTGEQDTLFTPPNAVRALLTVEKFEGVGWDPASGSGNISQCFYPPLISSDISVEPWVFGIKGIDFLDQYRQVDFIITNPPFLLATAFAKHALKCAKKVALLLRIQFLESQSRYKFFLENPPSTVYIPSGRIKCYSPSYKGNSKGISSQSLAWFVWNRGSLQKTVIEWMEYPPK